MVTYKRLKEVLKYSKTTGKFIWFERGVGRRSFPDAGHLRKDGYILIGIDGEEYLAHRLAWLYVYGVLPKGLIDHKDTIRHHNWIKNLRDTTKSGNAHNLIKAHKDSTTKELNVYVDKRSGKYLVKLTIKKKQITFGLYETLESAKEAALKARRKHYLTNTL